jgi:RHS repeat-associated protein
MGLLWLDRRTAVAELDGDGKLRSLFLHATQALTPDVVVRDGRSHLIVHDHVGSPRLVIDAESGDVVQAIRYDAFGRIREDTAPGFQPFGFSGGLRDDVAGLVHFGARSYDPELGRFTTRDPLLFDGGMTNLYGYADHDPVNRVDPTGMQVELCRSPTDILGPASDVMDTEHWWLRTGEKEAGMLPDPRFPSVGFPTYVGDETGDSQRPGSTCDPVDNVDEDCVNQELATNSEYKGMQHGRELGYWGPGNTCQDFADDVLRKCAYPGTEPVVETSDDFPQYHTGPDLKTTGPQSPAPDYTPDPGYTPVDMGDLWQ